MSDKSISVCIPFRTIFACVLPRRLLLQRDLLLADVAKVSSRHMISALATWPTRAQQGWVIREYAYFHVS
eukprot:1138640-Pelagomonas_calceolata.AAC.1